MKKLALVTGANGNLGTFVVSKFISEGFYVIGFVHKKTVGTLSTDSYEEIELNILDENNVHKNIKEIIEKHNKIDVAVLTAGGFEMGNINSSTSENVLEQYKLNFETAYNVARPVFINMLEQNNGRIFLIGSKPGLNVSLGKSSMGYALSKSLIFRLAELLNAEAKGKDVVVSVIVPSTIDTPSNRKSMPEADFNSWVKPEQIADIIYRYSSEENDVIREPVIKVYNKS
ncbi:MAG: SDR family NAD(P)-dependent oxidoreductase [Ferruginibacter sp.]